MLLKSIKIHLKKKKKTKRDGEDKNENIHLKPTNMNWLSHHDTMSFYLDVLIMQIETKVNDYYHNQIILYETRVLHIFQLWKWRHFIPFDLVYPIEYIISLCHIKLCSKYATKLYCFRSTFVSTFFLYISSFSCAGKCNKPSQIYK